MSEDEFDEMFGWDYERGEASRGDGPERDPLQDLPEQMTDEEWKRLPKRWSTMVLLTEVNSSRIYTHSELTRAALNLMRQGTFDCSWSEKWGELVFWASDVPPNEVNSEVV